MELPPAKLRRYFKFLKITLQAPRHWTSDLKYLLGRDIHVHERAWNVSEIDWLYPVRELHRLGFRRLQRVDIEVKYYPEPRANGWVDEMVAWTNGYIASNCAAISAEKGALTFVERKRDERM